MSKHTVKIYGASDDLIELEGDVDSELSGGDEPTYLLFSTGTQVKVWYGDDGVWEIEIVEDPQKAIASLGHGIPDDVTEGGHGDPDASSYSDILTLRSDRKIELVSHGTKPQKALKNRDKAQKVIDILDSRGGFDGWWYDVEEDDKNEILAEIAALFDGLQRFP